MADSFVVGSLVDVTGRGHGMLEMDNEDGTWSVGFDDGSDGDILLADIKLAEVQMRRPTSSELDAAALLAKLRNASTAAELAVTDERTKELLKLAWNQGGFMSEIIPRLWIGDKVSASQDLAGLHSRGICAVVNCTVELPNYHETADGLNYLRIPVADEERADISAHFNSACEFIDAVMNSADGAVLVHCHAGRSRSATIVLVFLMRRLGISLSEAMAKCMAKRWVTPNPGFQAMLAREEHRLSVGSR